ncbi:MAG: hypothetical protein IJW61_00690 [Clostridia bacterium]|jgi:hypothetical protein|nr:hypothetical protein [Clostridia bacterium]MBQ9733746.1 hypothetical protein [Clostridia bacterium]
MAKKYSAKSKAKREPQGSMSAPDKMQLLFTVVNRNKTEFYMDLLGNFEVNLQMVLNAHGTAEEKHLELLGLADSDRTVIISVIRRDRAKDALAALEEKFRTVKGGKGIAYTVPMKSTIGVAIYQFLSNKK